jgi:uncharacterized protein
MIEIIIKPTTRCNLSCLYCNLENISNVNITINTIKKFFAIIVERYPEEIVNIRWHGGEPLLMGLEFFNNVIDYQNELSTHFENEISTNVTLLNMQWIDFFKKNHFAIFTSLDGIGSKHDFQRNNSFSIVKQALIDLKSSGIQNISVRSTVTRYNADALEEVYDFCSLLQLKWTFSVIIPSGIKKKNAENLVVNPTDFNTAIIRIFDKWFMTTLPTDIQPFQNIIEYFIRREEYEPDGKPSLSFGPDGNIYACSLLTGNSKYALGKFNDKDIMEKFNCLTCSWQRTSFGECENCNFEFLCNLNRCAYLSMVQNSFASLPNYLCSCWKPIYAHILEQVTNKIHN